MNGMMHIILDECDITAMVNRIVLVWYVLLCMFLWLCGMCKHGSDMRWLTCYDMMYMIYDMTYMTDRLYSYSMNCMIEENEQTWNDLSEWMEYMNELCWLTWMIRIHVYVVYS